MWVQERSWDLHPNVEKLVWAFCAEGDGVEYVNEEPCSVPGPTIRVTKGDLVRLTFRNTHTVAHTAHFHGWHPFQADMNGAELVSEAMLVRPGAEATIEWIAEPAGTFIYHCHFQTPTHMDMGMYGAFIVEGADEADPPDEEFIAVLDEWAVHESPEYVGNFPVYNFFTINGRSFPLTAPWIAEPDDHVRIHMVNAGFEFHAMHLHGYTPDSWEGVAGPRYAVPTDVREIAPGQSVVLDFVAEREGVWLFHDHVVPRVTAASTGAGFGAYPRGMLTALVVGETYVDALGTVAPELLAAAARDAVDPEAAHVGHDHDEDDEVDDAATVRMVDFAFATPTLTVDAGTTVTWINYDPAYHTVTFDDGSADSGQVLAGESWSTTFIEPGTYNYHCIPHSVQDPDTNAWRGMVGTVLVEERS